MLKLFVLIFLCVVMLFTACKKDDYTPTPGLYTPVAALITKGAGVATPVTGTWQWVKSFHSTSGTSSPGTTNYSEQLKFGTDSIMTVYRNGSYYYDFKYLYQADYKYNGRTFNVTYVNGFTYETVIRNDTLTLSTFDLIDQNQLTYTKAK